MKIELPENDQNFPRSGQIVAVLERDGRLDLEIEGLRNKGEYYMRSLGE